MTDTGASGTPGGAPGGTPSNSGSNSAAPARPAMPTQVAGNPEQNRADNSDRTRGHSPAMDSRQQQSAPAEAVVKFSDGSEYSEADLRAALGDKAAAASRAATLPSSPDGYEIKVPDDFVGPEGVKWEWNMADPALKAAREIAFQNGIPSDVFQKVLGVYASTQMGTAIQQAQMHDVNMRALGPAAGARVEAIATWLQAHVPGEGKAVADFLRKYPSAPIVKTMEGLMRKFVNSGISFDQRGRVAQETTEGKIAGYENMSMVQRRVAQMQQKFGGGRNNDR